MDGGAAREDENKRTPMHWDASPKGGFTTGEPWWPMTDEEAGIDVATQTADPGSLLTLYKRLVPLRKKHLALCRGDQRRIDQKAGKGVVSFLRCAGDERVLVVANVDKLGVPAFQIAIPGRPEVIASERLDAAPTSDGVNLTLALGPWSPPLPPFAAPTRPAVARKMRPNPTPIPSTVLAA